MKARKTVLLAFLVMFSSTLADRLWALSPLHRVEIASRVEVTGDAVYLSDIVVPESVPEDWFRKFQSIYLGEAPQPGEVKYVQVALLADYLRKVISSNMMSSESAEDIVISIPDEVVVSRKTIVIPKEEIEKAYVDYVLAHSPWDAEDIKIEQIRYAGLPVVPAGTRTYEVSADRNERFLGNVTLTVRCLVNGRHARTLRVAGFVRLFKEVIHASEIIPKGSIIDASKLSWKRADITESPEDYVTEPSRVIGKRVLQDVYPGEPIKISEIDDPIVVRRGDPVKIVFQRPGLILTAKGQVKEDGRVGDVVKVINLSSRKVIQCRVASKDVVMVE
ncbi:flagellar basal body P-ring formation chaperone FlgA [Thermodesulforhabdus norvegica]|uniref:Flagella basal body P-ring formation protein FlgA n=1 Tax=Thermodesulforhabdus norvegica TaxID=39841 RepID=A0A1I4R4R6_9BACT|nr:flagellar basal body P-ring formation chaperone FlgA [Thermodesulforhabdus norvegica]SFM47251.1 flagella basal body P-ring formation protein FlgA [Thermodesulforhabdus norvegica]